ncbi:PH domain-containing protein [Microbacterium indicum]|uniref:PH domain-containing protein n=1 Tax=Microbacterium indicum TaxID=358100 RepID=UPI0004243406|nr:PH domain-containing protein [Microbacterium indicum]
MSENAPAEHPASRVARLLADGGSSNLADGEWHRLHPLTPLFKGGLVLIIVLGIVIANMRDRLIYLAIGIFAPHEVEEAISAESNDPVSMGLDWLVAQNLLLLGAAALLVVAVVLVLGYWAVWRFQQFRITGERVEIKKGIVFRSQRQAPLDRLQGVDLTRPFPARLIGMAKLRLEGAGSGAGVDLEYLTASKAESVRRDILQLASGVRAARAQERGGPAASAGVATAGIRGAVGAGVQGLIEGVDRDDVVPESVVKIPLLRLIGSQAVSAILWILFFLAILLCAVILPILLFENGPERWIIMAGAGFASGIPMFIAVFAIVWSALSKGFRYSIAPTPDGVRISGGLLTTVSRTIPPGRVHAVEITQSLLWRPFGWWTVRINRMGSQSAAQQANSQQQAAATVLPVGKRADVERVVELLMPDAPAGDALFAWEHGIQGPKRDDPFTIAPRRAWIWHPFARRRRGVRVTGFGVLLRRGLFSRRLALFPLARLQGVSLRQGVFARSQRLAALVLHTVPGPVTGRASCLDLDDAQRIADLVSRGSVAAASADHTHRWAS